LLVPVENAHAVDEENVEDGDGDERNEETEDEERVGPRLAVANARPVQLARHLHRQPVT